MNAEIFCRDLLFGLIAGWCVFDVKGNIGLYGHCFQLYCTWLEKRGLPRKFARFVLFRLIEKRSFNLLCVLDLFFRTLAVNSVSDLKKKKNRPQKPLRLIRDGEVGGSGTLYLTPIRYTVTTTMILH